MTRPGPGELRLNDPVDLSIRQFCHAWRVMCAGAPGNAMADGVRYTFSGIPIGFFNVALLTGRGISSDALQAHARDASSWASTHRVPWLFVTHERLARPRHRCEGDPRRLRASADDADHRHAGPACCPATLPTGLELASPRSNG